MTAPEKIITEQSVTIDIDSVRPYRKNPRIGDVAGIQESLRENGQFRPIIVQRSTGEILGGNHTWKAAKAEGWTKISAAYVDVDDETAKKIVLADNRLNDKATYDTDILGDILASMSSPVGTGYDQAAYDALVKSVQENSGVTDEVLQDIMRPTPTIHVPAIGQDHDTSLDDLDVPLGQESAALDEDSVPEAEKEAPDKFKEADDTINGAFGLKIDVQYELVGKWNLPPLRPEMLVQPDEIDRGLLAWAGSATKDWPDPDQWWLYNYGIDSTSGMQDISKMIVSFYCWDHYFEAWWDYPDRYTAKMLNSGVKYAVMPDFSQWANQPRVLSLYNLYRNRWLARYFQEAGIKVIPNISWRYADRDYYDTIVRPTLPKDLPVIAIQLQTFDKNQTEQELADLRSFVEHVGQTCDPDLTIFYVGKQGADMVSSLPWPGEKLIVKNRMEALAAQAKGRTKKRTL